MASLWLCRQTSLMSTEQRGLCPQLRGLSLNGARRLWPARRKACSSRDVSSGRLRQSGGFLRSIKSDNPCSERCVAPSKRLQHRFLSQVGKLLIHPRSCARPN
jgi:hypothetical protein